ncbi:MAG: right-handed parallel beta-helix repeat-containing protein [bacterium]|nr:right-handed parallel beta-helix repeat-containing protein [bacterium]
MNHKYFLSLTIHNIGFQSLVIAILYLVVTLPANADFRTQPIVLPAPDGSVVKTSEICGDFIDQDADGKDLLCSGNDQDRDGYAKGTDCDDTNRYIYPGVSVGCDTNCGTGWKTCGGNGAFTACICTPLCEATGSGKCYYVSALTGDDSNPGTFNRPWKSFANFTHYHYTQTPPPTWIGVIPGDVVYVMSGLYSETVITEDGKAVLYLRGINGTSNNTLRITSYPGQLPVIAPKANAQGIKILQTSGLTIEGMEISNSYFAGIIIQESSNIKLSRVHVKDTDGEDNYNMAGVHVGNVDQFELNHSIVHDNYDRTNADTSGVKTENSANVVLFAGGDAAIKNNIIFQTPVITSNKTGGCVKYKHASIVENALFNVTENVFYNCSMFAVGSGTSNTNIYNNLILNSSGVVLRDWGGTTHLSDIQIQNNTFVNSVALYQNSEEGYSLVGPLKWSGNLVVDNDSYFTDRGTLTISTYGTDEQYSRIILGHLFAIENNCYFNSSGYPIKWNIFNMNGGDRGNLGGMLSLAEFQQIGYEINSVITNPKLDKHHISPVSPCNLTGWQVKK